MAYDGTKAVNLRWARHGADVRLSWDSAAPPGTPFQVYVDGFLASTGDPSTTRILPTHHGLTTVDVGAVARGEEKVNFSASLPAPAWGGSRPVLRWYGGTYLKGTLASFRVYGPAPVWKGDAPGVERLLGSVPAYAGTPADGFGQGGFGQGGFGRSVGVYSFTAGPLRAGASVFRVVPVDSSGNEGTPLVFDVTVGAQPPQQPARSASGKRLNLSYSPTTRVATLSWLAPPP